MASALLPLGIYIAFATLKARRLKAIGNVPEFAYTFDDTTLAALSARFEAAYKKAGRPLSPSQTYREQFAGEATDTLTETGKAFARLYDRARFGGVRDREMRDRLTAAVEEVERQAAAKGKSK